MTKKEFIKVLENRLSILNALERQDIIDEYKDIISEKVKHGKTEEEAIADFGNIDELIDGILGAYKINPEYYQNDEDAGKEFLKNGETLIKRFAHKLADFSRGVFDNFRNNSDGITVELIFEILIKIVIFLLIMAIIKVPFYLIHELGENILEFNLAPIDSILGFIWKVIVGIIYLVVCILIGIAMFSKYFVKGVDDTVKEEKKENKVIKVNKKEERKVKDNRMSKAESKEKGDSPIINALVLIVKIFLLITFLLPMLGVVICGIFGFSTTIYLLIKGFDVWGVSLLALGGTIIMANILYILWQLLFGHKKLHFYPSIVGLVITIVGLFMTFDMISKYEFYDRAPEGLYEETVKRFEERIDRPTVIEDYSHDLEIVVDNNLEDNKAVIEVYYYKDLIDISLRKNTYDEDYNEYAIVYHSTNFNRKILDNILSDFKDYKIYNYNKLTDYHTKVYVNEKTKSLIKKEYEFY